MVYQYICLGTICSYYCCHCYIFTKTLIDEQLQYFEQQTENTTSEAERLIQHNQTNVIVHENNIISLPEIDMQTQKIELSFTQGSRRSRYRPTQSFISMNESNMLDVLYE